MKQCIAVAFSFIMLVAACATSPGMIQTAIARTQAAYTPTPEPTATQTLPPIETGRIMPMPEGKVIIFDTTADESWDTLIERHANNYNVKPPYRWETYGTDKTIKFKDVIFYYTRILRPMGYAIDYTNYSKDLGGGTSLFTSNEQSIFVVVYDESTEYDYTSILVIYKDVQ